MASGLLLEENIALLRVGVLQTVEAQVQVKGSRRRWERLLDGPSPYTLDKNLSASSTISRRHSREEWFRSRVRTETGNQGSRTCFRIDEEFGSAPTAPGFEQRADCVGVPVPGGPCHRIRLPGDSEPLTTCQKAVAHGRTDRDPQTSSVSVRQRSKNKAKQCQTTKGRTAVQSA